MSRRCRLCVANLPLLCVTQILHSLNHTAPETKKARQLTWSCLAPKHLKMRINQSQSDSLIALPSLMWQRRAKTVASTPKLIR